MPRYQSTFHPDSNHVAFGDRDSLTPVGEEYLRLHEIAISERDDIKRAEATNAILQLVADQWIGVPIVQGVSLYASNPETVGRWQGIYGRGELGDVFQSHPPRRGQPLAVGGRAPGYRDHFDSRAQARSTYQPLTIHANRAGNCLSGPARTIP